MMAAQITPDTRVRPPALMLAAVPVVAPAPGMAPIRPATTFPIPTPISSRLGLWSSPVIESATKAVSRLLMEAIRAMVRAGTAEEVRVSRVREGNTISGMPVGTVPITGASVNTVMPSNVPTINATTEAGSRVRRRRGQRMLTPMATTPRTRALTLALGAASGHAWTAASAPPRACSLPSRGRVVTKRMIPPTPVVNPDTTGYGV